jgi:N-dimethylarginine dimethylaminohydrolase
MSLPATDHGPGWRGRVRAHAEELGSLWRAVGQRNAWAPLRHVLLARPPQSLGEVSDPDASLLYARVELSAARRQLRGLGEAYVAAGVEVSWIEEEGPPNLIFQADTFFMTPEGAVLGRMAGEVRAGEERITAAALARLGVPLLASPRGRATLEGADALFLDEGTVLIGVGLRTNAEGAALLEGVLGEQGLRVRRLQMPDGGVQHLLGLVNFIRPGLAALRRGRAPRELHGILGEHGYALIDFPEDEETQRGRAMNFLALAPGRVLMPAGSPKARARLEAAGVQVVEVDLDAVLPAAGGVGCLTGVLRRSAGPG